MGLLFVSTWLAASGPGGYGGPAEPFLIAWFVSAILWLALLVMSLAEEHYRVRRIRWRPWLYFPAFAAVMFVALRADAPLWLAYICNRPAMDNVAHSVIDSRRLPSKVHWIGMFPVRTAWRTDAGVIFYLAHTGSPAGGSPDGWGFVYSASDSSRPRPGDFGLCHSSPLHHLSGHWYTIEMTACVG